MHDAHLVLNVVDTTVRTHVPRVLIFVDCSPKHEDNPVGLARSIILFILLILSPVSDRRILLG
jgi:hypothetical protein